MGLPIPLFFSLLLFIFICSFPCLSPYTFFYRCKMQSIYNQFRSFYLHSLLAVPVYLLMFLLWRFICKFYVFLYMFSFPKSSPLITSSFHLFFSSYINACLSKYLNVCPFAIIFMHRQAEGPPSTRRQRRFA